MNFRDLFYCSAYYVAFRLSTDKSLSRVKEESWTIMPSRPNEWFADPFPFEWQGRHYIFAERMDRWRGLGSIAVSEINESGKPSRFKDVLVEPFHLSYPNVFSLDGEIYMIPESGENGDIRLYRASHFPMEWVLVKVLAQGANYVDTSFIRDISANNAILNTQDWDTRQSVYFKFDLNNMELTRLPDNPQMKNERNGGNVFDEDGVSYRVLQDCSRQYGEKLLIRRIDNDDFEGGLASDASVLEIVPKDLKLDNFKYVPTICHTYNRSERLEVIDFGAERFIWFGPVSSARNKYLLEKQKRRQLK